MTEACCLSLSFLLLKKEEESEKMYRLVDRRVSGMNYGCSPSQYSNFFTNSVVQNPSIVLWREGGEVGQIVIVLACAQRKPGGGL